MQKPLLFRGGVGVEDAAYVNLGETSPTPTQFQVNSALRCSGHAGGMTDLKLLKGRG
jgi:hypothetical protein